MSTAPAFGTELIGRTEKALNAILDQQLRGTDLTEPQWVALTIAVVSGGTIDRATLVRRAAGALKTSDTDAQARIDELVTAGLLEAPDGDDALAAVTDTGRQFHRRVRAGVAEITERLWGDLPDDELAVAGRVLGTVLERANELLAQVSGR